MVLDFLLSQIEHENMPFKLCTCTCKANMCISVFKIKIKHMSTLSLNHQIKLRLQYLFKVNFQQNAYTSILFRTEPIIKYLHVYNT